MNVYYGKIYVQKFIFWYNNNNHKFVYIDGYLVLFVG